MSEYIMVTIQPSNPYYPMAGKNGRVLQHRYVVANSLGRCLRKTEVVHHKNGNKSDNRLQNLELLPDQAQHNTMINREVFRLQRILDQNGIKY